MEIKARCFETDWGWFGMGFHDHTLRVLTLPEPSEAEAREGVQGPWEVSWSPVGQDLEQAIRAYLTGSGSLVCAFPLDFGPMTPFQMAVMKAMKSIPYGDVLSYRDLAMEAGYPGAFRAVGQVCALNPIPLIVPCHRVIASDGTLGGFGGGLPLKERLLNLEGVEIKEGRVIGR